MRTNFSYKRSQVPGNTGIPEADSCRRRQTPDSCVQDPNSPRSRRELATTPIAPPTTKSIARLLL